MTLPGEVAATFSATLVDEWARCGLRRAVVSPGSRSTPLAVALAADPRMQVDVRLDERSAGFYALGLALGSGLPAIVLTTSGTAAAELHASVVEAHHARVPLVVCTADRPPELRDVGAGQTIDQQHLYGSAVRLFVDPGPPDEAMRHSWRSLGSRLVAEATSGPFGPGPVHLNVPFREPLLGEPGQIPPGRPGAEPWHRSERGSRPGEAQLDVVARLCGADLRGVIVAAGGPSAPRGDLVTRLSAHLGWPAFVSPRASAGLSEPAFLVGAADTILRDADYAGSALPDVVLQLGDPPASRVVNEWLAGAAAKGALHVLVDPYSAWRDPGRDAALVVSAAADAVVEGILGRTRPAGAGSAWAESWRVAEGTAQQAIEDVLASHLEATEPALARRLYALVEPESTIVVSSSMPVRDLEWFGRPREDPPRVLANRGANGIDGVVSTMLGVASATSGRTFGLVGDLALLHDATALVRGREEPTLPASCRSFVVDNEGGGIFSFLPQAARLDDASFEALFATPQRPRPADLLRGLGVPFVEIDSLQSLPSIVAAQAAGFVVVRTGRRANVAVHEEITRAVTQALRATL